MTLHFISAGSAWSFRCHGERSINGRCLLATWEKRQRRPDLIPGGSTPRFFGQIGSKAVEPESVRRVLEMTSQIADTDAESALAAFRSSAPWLKKVSVKQFEEWVGHGLATYDDASTKARRSYFALETLASRIEAPKNAHRPAAGTRSARSASLRRGTDGKGGRDRPLSAMPEETRIGDGKTIYLPTSVAEFEDDEKDFRLYKVLAAHGAGQIEFGTYDKDTTELKAAFNELTTFYSATAQEKDAFSLDGYLGEDLEITNSRSEIRKSAKKLGLP